MRGTSGRLFCLVLALVALVLGAAGSSVTVRVLDAARAELAEAEAAAAGADASVTVSVGAGSRADAAATAGDSVSVGAGTGLAAMLQAPGGGGGPVLTSTAHLGWKVTKGPRMRSIAVLKRNTMYGVSRWGRALKYVPARNMWTRMSPRSFRVRDLAVGCRGNLFAVRRRNGTVVARAADGAWAPLVNVTEVQARLGANYTAAPEFVSVAAGAKPGDVYALARDGSLWRYGPRRAHFARLPGKFRSVSVKCTRGADTAGVFAVSANGGLYRLISRRLGRWVRVASGLRSVAAGKRTIVIGRNHRAYHLRPQRPGSAPSRSNGGNGRRRRRPIPLFIQLRRAGAARDGTVAGIKLDGRAVVRVIEDPIRDNLGIEAAAVLRRSQRGTWRRVRGARKIVQAFSPGRGKLYGVTRGGKLLRLSKRGASTWVPVPLPKGERVRRVTATCDGLTIAIVTRKLHTYLGNANAPRGDPEWSRVHESLSELAGGHSAQQLWGIKPSGRIVAFEAAAHRFALQRGPGRRAGGPRGPTGATMRSIAVGCDGAVWGVTRAGAAVAKPAVGGSWRLRARGVRAVARAGAHTFVLGRRGMLYMYRRGNKGRRASRHSGRRGRRRNLKPMRKRLRRVFGNADGELFGIDMRWRLVKFAPLHGSLSSRRRSSDSGSGSGSDSGSRDGSGEGGNYEDESGGRGWRRAGVRINDVCAGSRDSVWATQGTTVLRWSDATASFTVVPAPPLRRVHCGCDGSVWGSDIRARTVYRYRNIAAKGKEPSFEWERVPGSSKLGRVSAVSSTKAWGVDRRGQPVQWDEATLSWIVHPGKLRDIAASCKDGVVGIGRGGGIWERDGATGKWGRIGAGGVRASVGARDLYVIGKRGHLFKRELELPGEPVSANGKRWEILGRLRRVSAAADGTVWGVDKLGNAWQVHHEQLAELPVLSNLKVKKVSVNPADSLPTEPDGTPLDPFRAGMDPEAIALRKLDKQLSLSDVEKIATEGGSETDHAEALTDNSFDVAPQPSLAPEATQGDEIAPNENLKKSELVDFVNFGYDQVLGDP
jgi:virginiamycin B lyase